MSYQQGAQCIDNQGDYADEWEIRGSVIMLKYNIKTTLMGRPVVVGDVTHVLACQSKCESAWVYTHTREKEKTRAYGNLKHI